MYFKALIIIALSMTIGCELRTKDKAPDGSRAKLRALGCLKNLNSDVTTYLEGKSSEAQVSRLLGCVRGALEDFEFYSYGVSQDGFYAEELAEFLNKNFLGKSKITPELLSELMNIKLLMVGGDGKFVTTYEFKRLKELTELIESEAKRNLPFIKIYRHLLSEEEKSKMTLETLKAADTQLTTTILKISDLFRTSKKSYSAQAMLNFVEEARKFLRWEERKHVYNWSSKQIVDLAFLFKRIVAGDDGSRSEIEAKDWDPILGALARWYIVYIEYSYLIKERQIHYGPGLDHLSDVSGTALELLKASIRIQESGVLSTELILNFVKQLSEMKVIPEYLKFDESLKPVITYAINDLFWDRRQPKLSTGMTVYTVNEIEREWNQFLIVQKELADSEESNSPFGLNFMPLSPIGDNRLFLVPKDELNKFKIVKNIDERTRINVIQSLTRLLIKGWAKDGRRSLNYTGITESETENFYQVVKNLGRDLKLMDPRSLEVGKRIFKEANLFTWSGNGLPSITDSTKLEDLMTHRESTEQVLLIHSTGQVRDNIYNNLVEVCAKQHESKGLSREEIPVSPVFGDKMIKKECLLDELAAHAYNYYNNLPRFTERLSNSDSKVRKALFNIGLQLGEIPCNNPDWIERSQIGTMTGILHYVELLFSVYDSDLNNSLDQYEIFKAFPRFYNYLNKEVTALLGEALSVRRLKAVFAFLISEERVPTSWSDKVTIYTWEKLYFNDDPNQYLQGIFEDELPSISATRKSILGLLRLLQENSKIERACPILIN